MGIRRQLARAIFKSGSTDPETIAAYLIKHGWHNDCPEQKRPKIQQVTVVPASAIPQVLQSPLTQLPDMRSLPVDFKKQRYLR